jgi:hypothetical protein
MQPPSSSQQKADHLRQRRLLTRRRAIRTFFFGSMLTVGASLAYRIGRILSQQGRQSILPNEVASTPISQAIQTISPSKVPATQRPAVELPTRLPQSLPSPTQTPESSVARSATTEPTPDHNIYNTPEATPEDMASRIGASGSVAKPDIISQKTWGGVDPAGKFIPQRPQHITLHHEGVLFDGSIAASHYLRNVQHWSIVHQHWPDIPYHFIIDLEGRIYAGRPLDACGNTNTSYDVQNHALIALLGKYDAGEQSPNQSQLDSIVALMAWIADSYNISPDRIKGHRDFIPINDKGEHIDPHTHEHVTCPGDNLYHYLANHTIQNRVTQSLDSIRRTNTQKQCCENRQ